MSALFDDIPQIAIITPDAGGTIRTLQGLLGLGAFKCWDYFPPKLFNTTWHGAPAAWRMQVATGWVGAMQVEVIQPTGGASTFQEYLDEHARAGIGHLLVDRGRASYAEMKRRLGNAGYPIEQEGQANGALRIGPITIPPMPQFLAERFGLFFCYTSTMDSLKVCLETAQFPPGVTPRRGFRLARPEWWIGDDHDTFERVPAGCLFDEIRSVTIVCRDIVATAGHYSRLTDRPLAVEEGVIGEARVRRARLALRTTAIDLVEPVDPFGTMAVTLGAWGEGCNVIGATTRKRVEEVLALAAAAGLEPVWRGGSEIHFVDDRLPFAIVLEAAA